MSSILKITRKKANNIFKCQNYVSGQLYMSKILNTMMNIPNLRLRG